MAFKMKGWSPFTQSKIVGEPKPPKEKLKTLEEKTNKPISRLIVQSTGKEQLEEGASALPQKTEASEEEKKIMNKMDNLEKKMTALEKEGKQDSEEYKKLEEEHRDLDNQLYPYG